MFRRFFGVKTKKDESKRKTKDTKDKKEEDIVRDQPYTEIRSIYLFDTTLINEHHYGTYLDHCSLTYWSYLINPDIQIALGPELVMDINDSTIYFKWGEVSQGGFTVDISHILQYELNCNGTRFRWADFIENYTTDKFSVDHSYDKYRRTTAYLIAHYGQQLETPTIKYIYWLVYELGQLWSYMGEQGFSIITDLRDYMLDQMITVKNQILQLDSTITESFTVNSIDPEIREHIVNCHVTTRSTVGSGELRQIFAKAYQYVRTFDKWFGYKYAPFEKTIKDNTDDTTYSVSEICYCNKINGIVTDVTTVDYSESDIFNYIYEYYWSELYQRLKPIRHLTPNPTSIDDRNEQFTESLNLFVTYLNGDNTIKEDVINYFNSIVMHLGLSHVQAMVSDLIKKEGIVPVINDYLRDSLDLALSELQYLRDKIETLLFTRVGDGAPLRDFLGHEYEISTDYFYYFISQWNDKKRQVVSGTEYYPNINIETDGIEESETQRWECWNNIYNIIPNYLENRDVWDTMRYGESKYMNKGITDLNDFESENGSITPEQVIIIKNDTTKYVVNRGPVLAILLRETGEEIGRVRRNVPAFGTRIIIMQLLYELDEYLHEKTLVPISLLYDTPSMLMLDFLYKDIELLSTYFTTIGIEFTYTTQEALRTLIKGGENGPNLNGKERMTLQEFYKLYELIAVAGTSRAVLDNILFFRKDGIDQNIVINNPDVFLTYVSEKLPYYSEYDVLPNTFTNATDTTIISNNEEYQKEIIMKIDDTHYIPVLEFEWHPEKYLQINYDNFIPEVITKETYIKYLNTVTTLQSAVLTQISEVCNICITELFDNFYKLECYNSEQVRTVSLVVNNFISGEMSITAFLNDNINEIKELFTRNEGETEDQFIRRITLNRMKIGPLGPQYNQEFNYDHIIEDNVQLYLHKAYPNIEYSIENSDERRDIWLSLKQHVDEYKQLLREHVPDEYLNVIYDIRKYTDRMKYIFKKDENMFMSTLDLSITENSPINVIGYTKYTLN